VIVVIAVVVLTVVALVQVGAEVECVDEAAAAIVIEIEIVIADAGDLARTTGGDVGDTANPRAESVAPEIRTRRSLIASTKCGATPATQRGEVTTADLRKVRSLGEADSEPAQSSTLLRSRRQIGHGNGEAN
jgi:hypothetical protein